jgi:hypothetical protein
VALVVLPTMDISFANLFNELAVVMDSGPTVHSLQLAIAEKLADQVHSDLLSHPVKHTNAEKIMNSPSVEQIQSDSQHELLSAVQVGLAIDSHSNNNSAAPSLQACVFDLGPATNANFALYSIIAIRWTSGCYYSGYLKNYGITIWLMTASYGFYF